MRINTSIYTVVLAGLLAVVQTGCFVNGVKGKKPSSDRSPLQIATDKTSSVSESILPAQSAKIMKAVEELDPTTVSVVRFGEESQSIWDTPEISVEMPMPPAVAEFSEEAAEKEINESCRARKPCRDGKIKDLREAHEEAIWLGEAQQRKERGEKLDIIAEAIVRAPSRSARCTDLYGTRDRIATDGYPRVILITDGQHTCANLSPMKTFPKHTKVLILLTSIKGESAGDGFDKRIAFVENLFPSDNVQVLPIVSATSTKITQALR